MVTSSFSAAASGSSNPAFSKTLSNFVTADFIRLSPPSSRHEFK
jgi:hypothetical protein